MAKKHIEHSEFEIHAVAYAKLKYEYETVRNNEYLVRGEYAVYNQNGYALLDIAFTDSRGDVHVVVEVKRKRACAKDHRQMERYLKITEADVSVFIQGMDEAKNAVHIVQQAIFKAYCPEDEPEALITL